MSGAENSNAEAALALWTAAMPVLGLRRWLALGLRRWLVLPSPSVRRAAFLVLLASCTEVEPPSYERAPSWVYAPALPKWQRGPLVGRLGRGQEPQEVRVLGLEGDPRVPLRDATAWAVPGEPARAVIFGLEGAQPAIELIEVDGGRVRWRSSSACIEPVIGVTAETIVCGGAKGVRGVSLAGSLVWKIDAPLVAITGAQIVVGSDRDATVVGADDGKERARFALPEAIELSSIVASCEGELFSFARDRLARIADVRGKAAATWQVPLTATPVTVPAPPPSIGGRPRGAPRPPPAVPTGTPVPQPPTVELVSIDCSHEPILVATRSRERPEIVPTERPSTLHALARGSGASTARIEEVRGFWPARGDDTALEVSTGGAVTRWPRDLSSPSAGLALPRLGALLDVRGDRRLVRATPFTAVVLDRGGVRAYVPLAATTAVLGADAIVAPALPARGGGVRRIAIPAAPRHAVRVPARRAGVEVPAELRDLPAATALSLDRVIAKPDTGTHGVAALALDPREPAALYAVALERAPTATTTATIARADLATGAWTWQRGEGCGEGQPIGLALADGIVACAARGTESTVRATTRDGAPAWQRTLDQIDAIEGAGSALIAHDADRATVLDAQTGRVLGRLASDDGGRVRAALVTTPIPGIVPADTTWLVTFERGRLVGRLPAVSMLAAWSFEVDGLVRAITPSGDGVLVALDDGDAYRIDLPTREVTALPGLGLVWRASGELVTGEARGGPIPGIPLPRNAFVPRAPVLARAPALSDRNPDAPDLWVPIAPPPALGDSWQYTLYEHTGGLRARNDYALAAPVIPTPIRGPVGSPLVIRAGASDVLVLDPRTGDPVHRATLPEGAPGIVFGTIVEGEPVAGTVLASPLRVVLF